MSRAPSAPLRHAGQPAPLSERQIMVVFGGLMLCMLLAALDQTIVNTAMPTIAGDLHGLTQISWVLTSYLLASTVVLMVYGKLGDLFGRKGLFMFAITLFLIGSMLSGLSQSMNQLIFFRALQGVGGGGLMIGAQAIIGDIVPPRERGKYMGMIGAVFGVSTVVGPLLGGFFTDNLSWRWCFYVNVPVGALALFVISTVLHLPKRRERHRLDVIGAVFMAVASVCLVLFTTWGGTKYAWSSAQVIGLGAGFVVAAALFVLAEHRASEPIMPLRLFRDPIFVVCGLLGFIIGVAMFGAVGYLPLFIQTVDGVSATMSGILLLPFVGGMLIGTVGSGALTTRTGRYKVFPIVGTAIATLGYGLMSLMSATSSRAINGVYMAVVGLGIGLCMQILVLAVQNSAPYRDLGAATASNNYLRQMGGTVGAAVVGALFVHRLTDRLQERLAGKVPPGVQVPKANAITPQLIGHLPGPIRTIFRTAFADALTPIYLYLVPVMVLAFVLAWFLKEIPLRTRGAQTAPGAGTLDPDRRAALVTGLALALITRRAERDDGGGAALTARLSALAGAAPGPPEARARDVARRLLRPAAVALLARAAGAGLRLPSDRVASGHVGRSSPPDPGSDGGELPISTPAVTPRAPTARRSSPSPRPVRPSS